MNRAASLATRARNYLEDVLGVPTTQPETWADEDTLPYFLRDSFEFQQLYILGVRVLLAIDRHPGRLTPGEIRVRLQQVRSTDHPVAAYVTGALASYERKRLIGQKVPFIVPGNQLYLPDLGVDLREYYRQPADPVETPLSPSAQAILISALLRPRWEPDLVPGEVAATRGYAPMTLSRAVREIVAAGLGEAQNAGRTKYLRMKYSPQETWQRAAAVLRSPVREVVWVRRLTPMDPPLRLSGLTALARGTMIEEPRRPVYAMNRTDWPKWQLRIEELPEALEDAQEWQLWNYDPALQRGSETVDPLSLILSLRDSPDERVQSALDELRRQLPW